MNKYIFFIFDYRSLIYALGLIDHLTKIQSIEFVVSLEPLSIFIKNLSIPNSNVFLTKKESISVKKVNKFHFYKKQLKNIYEKNFSHKKRYKIFFFDMGFELHLLYFIKRLCRKNSVFYYEYFSYPSMFTLENSLKSRINQFICEYIYSLKVDTYRISQGRTCLALKPTFLTENKINVIDNNSDFKIAAMLKKYTVKDSCLAEAKVLILYTDFASAGLISQHASDVFHEKLSLLLSRFFKKEDIIVKPHPTFGKTVSPFLRNYRIVDSNIPAEFFFCTGKIRIILGIGSLSQKSALELDELLFLPLYKLVGFKPIKVAVMEKQFCSKEMKECNRLLIPQTWNDLEEILQRNCQ
jgi:hypothetical protein